MLKKILWMTLAFFFGLLIGVITGEIEAEKKFSKQTIISEEIKLIIPQTEKDLKKQLIYTSAQKAMLEEIIKWNEKKKVLK